MIEPTPDFPPERHWREALAEGRLLVQRGPAGSKCIFPPRLASPNGGALDWVEATGAGTVYSTTLVHQRPPASSYNVALIDLEEGARLMSRVEGIPASEVTIGMPVQAQIVEVDGGPVLVFHPA